MLALACLLATPKLFSVLHHTVHACASMLCKLCGASTLNLSSITSINRIVICCSWGWNPQNSVSQIHTPSIPKRMNGMNLTNISRFISYSLRFKKNGINLTNTYPYSSPEVIFYGMDGLYDKNRCCVACEHEASRWEFVIPKILTICHYKKQLFSKCYY